MRSRASGAFGRFARCERGASLVEFAIVAPVFIFLIFGIVEMGRFLYYSIVVANAARAGAQYGAQNTFTAQDTTGMTNAASTDAQNLSELVVTPSYLCVEGTSKVACPASPPAGMIYYVQVNTSGTFHTLFKYPGIPDPVTVKGTSIMRVISQ